MISNNSNWETLDCRGKKKPTELAQLFILRMSNFQIWRQEMCCAGEEVLYLFQQKKKPVDCIQIYKNHI